MNDQEKKINYLLKKIEAIQRIANHHRKLKTSTPNSWMRNAKDACTLIWEHCEVANKKLKE
ncbi:MULTISPECIES: hypothetical protein [Desulfitobacterium]|uniref:Uncharacterized protein n=1 Tax=Desulfitobacterium chlororespirans DSM 11544 TaxID=1121395 RepID=A0A1M7UTP5_9FIRM|nr:MULTISPECIES: hypothetical protein [Desulfitobacterium]SHN86411.1 hypothetical protein SAMN02745215_04619 [Desulfitobacterium chlororespirans DSM 11544]